MPASPVILRDVSGVGESAAVVMRNREVEFRREKMDLVLVLGGGMKENVVELFLVWSKIDFGGKWISRSRFGKKDLNCWEESGFKKERECALYPCHVIK